MAGAVDEKIALDAARKFPGLVGMDLAKAVSCGAPYPWDESTWALGQGYGKGKDPRFHVVAYDYGIKRNILRKLAARGCRLTVLPAQAPAEEALVLRPDGIFLSNGPGDPEGVPYLIEAVRNLIGKRPIFGICLGHQIIGLALGGRTYKLKFGHHGGNQPVKDLTTSKVEITSQNHGFAVDMESFKSDPKGQVLGDPEDIVLTHVNLNDNTCEGLMHRRLPLFSVQYHPEASPGPHDASYLFKRFVEMMEQERTGSVSRIPAQVER